MDGGLEKKKSPKLCLTEMSLETVEVIETGRTAKEDLRKSGTLEKREEKKPAIQM